MNYCIVIPSKKPENLTRCVGALRARGVLTDNLLVVADGAPALEACAKLGVDVIVGDEPFCFARNVNLGINLTRRGVLILNDDALLVTPDGVEALVWAAEHEKTNVGAHRFGVVSAAIRGPVNCSQQREGCKHSKQAELQPSVVRQISCKSLRFVAAYIPRAVLDIVGGLDERFMGEVDGEQVYGGEDDAFCYTVRQYGYQLGVYDGCVFDETQLESTFRPGNLSRPINATRKLFRRYYGFEMGTR